MTSGNSTKMPNTSMFGARKNTAMPLLPVRRCNMRSGASKAFASQPTGARIMAPARVAMPFRSVLP